MSGPDAAQGRPVRTAPRPDGSGAPTAPSATAAGSGTAAEATTTAGIRRFGRRYPAVGRAAVGALCAVAAPFAAHPEGAGAALLVAVCVVAWNAVYLAVLLPDGRPRGLLVIVYAADLALICGLCLAEPLLADPDLQRASLGWISPIASFTVVAVQCQLPPWPAGAATLAVAVAFVAGTASSPGLTVGDGLLVGGGWMVVEAALSRLLWVLLLRAAREADRLMRARFAAERAAATAAARRADQRAHWATVHDTSASTLLMIGLGEVAGTEEWLPGQLRRDVALLDGRDDVDTGPVEVGAALRATVDRARLRVALDCPTDVTVPSAVAAAVCGALGEALENVRRHAGTGVAAVVVRGGDGRVEVAVTDEGRGFDPAAVGPQRFGLAWSVHDRMDAVGGCAVVESAPGRGTVVRLTWAS